MKGITALRRSGGLPRRMKGITLIELMVVVTIIGIIVAIAYPGYQAQIQKTRRADGKAKLLEMGQQLERCFTRFNAYNNAGCTIATTLAGAGVPSDGGWYLVTNSAPAASTFSLVATPQGGHTNDTLCANLTLNERGVRGATGSAAATCW